MKKFKKYILNKRVIFIFIVSVAIVTGGIFFYLTLIETMPQQSITLLSQISEPKAGEKVLVFTPHPDDESLGAAGYIAEAEQNHATVEIVLVTDGNKHGLKDIRYDEFRKSTGILGVPQNNLIFLNYADGSLEKTDQGKLYNSLKSQIDTFAPDIIIYNSPTDEHPDHATVGRTVSKIITDENLKVGSYQYLIHYSYFPQPRKFDENDYLLPPVRLVSSDNWQRFMLTPDAESKKNEAVRSYNSQLHTPILRSLMLSLVRRNELFNVTNTGN
jgi:LmbE family N-acetylglucosaminyl deacetylase